MKIIDRLNQLNGHSLANRWRSLNLVKSKYHSLLVWFFGNEWRKYAIGNLFTVIFIIAAVKFTFIAMQDPLKARTVYSSSVKWSQRAPIVDRNGMILATNLSTHALYMNPNMIVGENNIRRVIDKLTELFPDLDPDKLHKELNRDVNFVWVKHRLTSQQRQAVHDMGEPGIYMGARVTRIYPNGRSASHILGNTTYGKQAVNYAEIVGQSGIERAYNDVLNQPDADNSPLKLSIDLRIQSIITNTLQSGINVYKAKGGSATLMNVHTGEIMAMVSLPDFDSNDSSSLSSLALGEDSPRFFHPAQGVREYGSTFKTFTAAQALELGIANEDSLISNEGFIQNSYSISGTDSGEKKLTLRDVIAKSSNAATARLALEINAKRQEEFLSKLGLTEAISLEIEETGQASPILPKPWNKISVVTVSYGHGIAVSQLQLAAAYSTLVNGGYKVQPTLIKNQNQDYNPRQVISETTSQKVVNILRSVVTDGTASAANIPAYSIGGKTGSAEKPKDGGGYHKDKILATFASVFPTEKPEFVLIVTLDNATSEDGTKWENSAGKTSVPTAKVMISKVAPLLGIRPKVLLTDEIEI